MNPKKKLNDVYLPFFIAVILLSTILRTAAILVNFNAYTGYFDGKGFINAASAIITAGSVFLFSYSVAGKKQKLVASFSTPATYIPAGGLIASLLFFSAGMLARLKSTGYTLIGALTSGKIFLIIEALIIPLSLLAAVFFFLNGCVIKRASETRAYFGIAMVLLLALYASYLYFDTTLTINAPNKIVDQMAFVFSSLYFLYEIRISMGRECWSLYMAFGFIAAALTAYSSIPSLILFFARGITPSNNIYENVLTFCLFVFILSRIILATKLAEDKEHDSVTLLRSTAKERSDAIKEKEEAERLAYLALYNQLDSLDDANENDDGSEEEEIGVQLSFSELINVDEQKIDAEAVNEQDANDASENEAAEDNEYQLSFGELMDIAEQPMSEENAEEQKASSRIFREAEADESANTNAEDEESANESEDSADTKEHTEEGI